MNKKIISLLLIAIVYLSCPAWAEESAPSTGPKSGSLEKLSEPATITVWNRTITELRESYGELTAEERARRAVAKIEALPVRPDYKIDYIEVSEQGTKGLILKTQTTLLFALLPGDVTPDSDETLEDKARTAAERLQKVIEENADQQQWSHLVHSIGITTVATIIYFFLIWTVSKLKHIAIAALERNIARWKYKLTLGPLGSLNLMPTVQFIIRLTTKLATLGIYLSITYLWLTLCFTQFFFTQPWADQLGSFLIGFLKSITMSIIHAVPGLFMVFMIFWLTNAVVAGVSRFFVGVQRGYISVSWLEPDSARASRRIIIILIWLFSLTIAYPYIPGSGSDAFKGVSVFAGLMLSLGATGLTNHVMSGLAIAYSGAMRVGDFVAIKDIIGTVEELGPMSIKIATPKKEFVTVPNGVAISAHVTNYSRLAKKDGAIISTTITIGYDTPWRQVHALLLQSAEKTEGVRKSPEPYVLQRALSDFYVEYELRVSINQPDQRFRVLSTLHAEIQDAFNEVGVQIMSPNFVDQPAESVLVPKSKWYEPPAAPATAETDNEK